MAQKETNTSRKEELMEMANICRKVPEYSAESFREAIQSFWFTFLLASPSPTTAAGASTPAIVGPIAFTMGLAAGLHPILISVTIGCASLIGADNPLNGFGGVISRQLTEKAGFADKAFDMALYVWINSSIKQIVVIAIAYIIFKAYKAKRVEVVKPKAFNPVQKKTVILIMLAFVAMVVPLILNTWFKGIPLFKLLAEFCQPQSIMIIAAILAMALKLGDEKDVIRKLPMSSILMIAGVAILIGVAKEAKLVEAM